MKPSNPFKTLALALALGLAQIGHSQSMKTPWVNLTQEKMCAVWFQWLYSIPGPQSPWFDATGEFQTLGQPYFTAPGGSGQLLFLAESPAGPATRAVTMKQGTALFFPVLAGEWDHVGFLPNQGGVAPVAGAALGVPQLAATIGGFMDLVTDIHCTLTPANQSFNPVGTPVSVAYARLQSPAFAYTLPPNNFYEFYYGMNVVGTVAPAVADGYWSFIPGSALTPGNYLLHFDCQFGGLVEVTYQLTVTP